MKEPAGQAQRPQEAFQRSVSEPSQSLFPSIPHHLKHSIVSRYDSVADSRFHDTENQHVAHKSSETKALPDPLGLSLVYTPSKPEVDLIFVHGLGGSSCKTWAWDRDNERFWPSWLTAEPELSNARIFSFGYNANFRGPSSTLNIIDFGKDLLFRMLTFSGELEELNPSIGSVSYFILLISFFILKCLYIYTNFLKHPIVFVAHSMGGLIIKKVSGKTTDIFIKDLIPS